MYMCLVGGIFSLKWFNWRCNIQGMIQGNIFWGQTLEDFFKHLHVFHISNQHGWAPRMLQCSVCSPTQNLMVFIDQQRCFRWEDIGKCILYTTWECSPPSISDKWRQYLISPRGPRCNVILTGNLGEHPRPYEMHSWQVKMVVKHAFLYPILSPFPLPNFSHQQKSCDIF